MGKKQKKKFSLKYKVAILYLLLAMINISFFTSMILENQMQLLAENTEYKAGKFIDSIENSLKNIISKYRGTKVRNAKLNKKLILEIENFIAPLVKKNEAQYLLYLENGQIYKKSQKTLKLPPSSVYDTMRVVKDKDFTGKNYLIKINSVENIIYFYINLFKYKSKNNILFIQYNIKEINENIKYLYNLIALLVAIIVLFHIVFGFFVFKIILRPIKKLDDSSKELAQGNLETRVSIKTNDELESLGDTFNAMVQSIQDKIFTLHGDYFLSSLLLSPLAVNLSKSETVTIDVFFKQKMTFKFKKWNKEIGGDICYSNDIELRNKKYSLFMNADAMGKSIQGAGGAIVMGSVFGAVIDRTKYTAREKKMYPETWLRNSYMELQRVFESFDGSMFVSIIIGLVDNDTGLMYFFNAEHPWMVLYREGKSSFIENELILRKLGVTINEEPFTIKTFQMRKNDVIIAGSDGRDDILIEFEKGEDKKMNEDENLFLKSVEDGNGEIENIYNSIKNKGDITDDISLLSIKYIGEEVNKENQESQNILFEANNYQKESKHEQALSYLRENYKRNNHIDILKKIIDLYIQKKAFKDALHYLKEYIERNPNDTNYLYYTSYCEMKNDNINDALLLAERIHLRYWSDPLKL